MESNNALVDYLERGDHIRTERVREAFRSVDRERFVPEEHSNDAYSDVPLPIGEGATISAPHMVAINTELLDVGEGDTVLEIGSGSGYQLAVIAELTNAEVAGVERIEELVERSRDGLEHWENVRVVHGNGLDAVEGEFDRILFSCGIDTFDLGKEYLEDDGIMVAPVNVDRGQMLQKYIDSESKIESHGRVRFVPYRDKPV